MLHVSEKIAYASMGFKRRHGNSRVALVGKRYLVVMLVVGESYSIASIPLSSVESRWGTSSTLNDCPSLTFVKSVPGGNGELGANEITGELLHLWNYDYMASPWAVHLKAVESTWRRPPKVKNENITSPMAEILILKFTLSGTPATPTRLIVTKLQLSETLQ